MIDYFKNFTLSKGNHATPQDGTCFMEAANLLLGKNHSDQVACVSPTINQAGIMLNDYLPDELRDELLKPFVVRVLGTVSPEHEQARMFLCADRAVRVFAPVVFERAGLNDQADILRALTPVVDAQTASAADSAARAAHGAAACAAHAAADAARAARAACAAARAAACAARATYGARAYSAANAAADAAYYANAADAARAAHAAVYATGAASKVSLSAGWAPAIQLLEDLINIKPGTFDCDSKECVVMLERMLAESSKVGSVCGEARAC